MDATTRSDDYRLIIGSVFIVYSPDRCDRRKTASGNGHRRNEAFGDGHRCNETFDDGHRRSANSIFIHEMPQVRQNAWTPFLKNQVMYENAREYVGNHIWVRTKTHTAAQYNPSHPMQKPSVEVIVETTRDIRLRPHARKRVDAQKTRVRGERNGHFARKARRTAAHASRGQ